MSDPDFPLEDAVVTLTVPPVDVIEDLHGDPLQADLVLLLNGNQFMVMDELLAAFRTMYPSVQRIFYETLPPGILVEQVRRGGLKMGTLVLSVAPDVLAAGPDQLAQLHKEGWVGEAIAYASNNLAILVPNDNPAAVHNLADLGRTGVRIAMPDPTTEGVGRLIVAALEQTGGKALVHRVMHEKVATGETRLTQIHHRQSILWLIDREVDAAPLWSTEARYHVERGASVAWVKIDRQHNQQGHYALAVVERRTHHRHAASDFVQFMQSPQARAVYAHYGFSPPQAGNA